MMLIVFTVPAGLLLLVGVLFIQAMIAMRGTYLEPPTGVVEARLEPAKLREPAVLRLTVLGDSTVAGVGAPDLEGALPIQLGQRVADRLGRPIDVQGLGVSGARTADLLTSQVPRIGGADVVIVVIGSNDVTHATPPWTLRSQTAGLLDGIRTRPVVFGGIPLFGQADALARPLRTVVGGYAAVLRGVQRSVVSEWPAVEFVDIAQQASPRFRGVPDAMSTDGFHPAPVGYGFWADALAEGVLRALAERD